MNKLIVVAAAAALAAFVAGGVQAQEAAAKAAGCLNCHDASTKKVGPSFKDISAKYKGQADAADKLAAKLKEGKGHPAVKASDADIKGILTWVLAM